MSAARCQFCSREFASEVAVRNHVNKSPACKVARAAGVGAGAPAAMSEAAAAKPDLGDAETAAASAIEVEYVRAVYEYRATFADQVFQVNKEYVQGRGNVYVVLVTRKRGDSTLMTPIGSFEAKGGHARRVQPLDEAWKPFLDVFVQKFARDKWSRLTTKAEREAGVSAEA